MAGLDLGFPNGHIKLFCLRSFVHSATVSMLFIFIYLFIDLIGGLNSAR